MKDSTLLFTDENIVVNEAYNIENISCNDIISFQYEKPYIVIKKYDGKDIYIKISIINIIKMLPYNFVLCNRTTIVNLFYVKKLNLNTEVIMIDEKVYSLSRSKRKDFMSTFINIRCQKIICRKCECCNFTSSCINI